MAGLPSNLVDPLTSVLSGDSIGRKMIETDPIVNDFFLSAVAETENAPVFQQYKVNPNSPIESFPATGDTDKKEIGFGLTFSKDGDHGIKTAGDAFENLRKRYTKLIDKIANNSKRFSNIKEMPPSYQRVLLSIADNIGLTGLEAYEKLQGAMERHDREGIYNEMLTWAKLGGQSKHTPLSGRRENIFLASGI